MNHFTVTLGDQDAPMRVPVHMTARFRVYEALGEDFAEAESIARLCAVIGLCWAGAPLAIDEQPIPTLRALKYDLVEFGDYVYDALIGSALAANAKQIVDAATECHRHTMESIPTQDEVADAAVPFEVTEGASIATMSN